METIEKVIKKLEYCAENKCDICQEENGSGFPWIDGRCYGFTERLYDAIALLKMQEPVLIKSYTEIEYGFKPKVKVGKCPNCDRILNEQCNYCSKCGQAVRWE